MPTNKIAAIEGVRSELLRFFAPNGMWTVVRQTSPTGAEYLRAVRIPWTATKAELLPIFQEMASMKISQKAIAMFTGVSPSYVSKLLRERIGS